jgi:uncharacterized protein related to proFAR isomerase
MRSQVTAKLIAMLTYNDETVENALEVFEECKDALTKYWGFKDRGIEVERMKKLIDIMKKTGKTTFFEVLEESKEECLRSAKFAVEYAFDYLIGMRYFSSVNELLKNKPIKYYPTCGKRSGIPRMLDGSIEEIVAEAKEIEKAGVDGLVLSVYRYKGDPKELFERFLKEINIPVIVSGSINNYERLDIIKKLNPWGFTIGSAFFNNDFGKDLTFAQQIRKVADYIKN